MPQPNVQGAQFPRRHRRDASFQKMLASTRRFFKIVLCKLMDIGEAHPAAGKTADKGIRILQPYRWVGGASPFERIRTCLRKKPRKRLAIVLTQKASSAEACSRMCYIHLQPSSNSPSFDRLRLWLACAQTGLVAPRTRRAVLSAISSRSVAKGVPRRTLSALT